MDPTFFFRVENDQFKSEASHLNMQADYFKVRSVVDYSKLEVCPFFNLVLYVYKFESFNTLAMMTIFKALKECFVCISKIALRTKVENLSI